MDKQLVFLGLGGNLGDVLSRLKIAITMLSQTPQVFDLKTSHYYSTQPVQVKNPDWFVNAVCSFWTFLSPEEVFQMTQSIEKALGKENKPKYGDRSIDIDILFYGQQVIKNEALEIPHPRWKERLFVLIPLLDLTDVMTIHSERYKIQDLIDTLKNDSHQGISLLEKNPDLQ